MENNPSKTSVASLCTEIKKLLPIEEVVKYYINLKKKGIYYVCCCPFHKERTPSFFVNPSFGFYKCFGCGEAGDIFSFVEKYENVSFVETLFIFSERYPNVASLCAPLLVKKNENEIFYEKKRISCEVMRKVQSFFASSLLKETGNVAWDFLKKRGVGKEKTLLFGIGFCESGSAFFDNKDFSREDFPVMEEVGLLREGYLEKKEVPFKNKISFPFFDSLGNIVGFSWRRLADDEKKGKMSGPKYVNSPESFLFKKREVLFGFFQAKKKIRETRKCFVVEGFFDVLTMFFSGFENVVGVSGTALSLEQCSLLKKNTDCISLFFDNDEAGEKATLRSIEVCLKEGFMVNVVRIRGSHKDPDEFLRGKSQEEAENEIEKIEEDFVSFLFGFFSCEEEGIQGKTRTINSVCSFLSFIKDPVYKTLSMKKLSSLCGVSLPLLERGCVSKSYKKEEIKRDFSTIEEYENEVLFLLFKVLFFWREDYREELECVLDETKEDFFMSKEKREIMDLFLRSFEEKGKLEKDVLEEVKDVFLKKRIIGFFFKKGDTEGEGGEGDNLFFGEENSKLFAEEEGSSFLKLFSENVFFLKIKKIQILILKRKEDLKKCGEGEEDKILDEIEFLKKKERNLSENLKVRIF